MSNQDTKPRAHGHYFKDVRHLDYIDVYRVIDLFAVEHPAMQHALKKVIAAGQRGAKSQTQDAQEAIDSLNRYLQMVAEDCNSGVATIQGVVSAAQSTTLEDGSTLTASGPVDPHADLRKTWKPGQRWQSRDFPEPFWREVVGGSPMWYAERQYRRHPDDKDPPAPAEDVSKPVKDERPVFTGEEFRKVWGVNDKWECRPNSGGAWHSPTGSHDMPSFLNSFQYRFAKKVLVEKPWYPDNSGEWVEVPDDCMECPVDGGISIEVIKSYQRVSRRCQYRVQPAGYYLWEHPVGSENRIVAYKVVK